MGFEEKYPGLFKTLHPIAKASVKELFTNDDFGACIGVDSSSSMRIVYGFDREKMVIIDGYQVLPLSHEILENKQTENINGKISLRFSFNFRQFEMSAISSLDLELLSGAFPQIITSEVDSNYLGLDQDLNVALATTPYIHGARVLRFVGIVHTTANSVPDAIKSLKVNAASLGANAIVGFNIFPSPSESEPSMKRGFLEAYGTALTIEMETSFVEGGTKSGTE